MLNQMENEVGTQQVMNVNVELRMSRKSDATKRYTGCDSIRDT